MATPFKSIGIIGRVRNPGVKETFRALIDYLQQLGIHIYLEEDTATILNETSLPTLSREKLGSHCDLLIVVGGDGSLLHAAHIAVNQDLPVLGINRGSLGFLTDILPTELPKIEPVLRGEYHLEKRFLLTTSIEIHGNNIGQDDCLNEVAIIPDAIPHMIEFEIYIDDQFVCSQNSDGLIIATPTGSTAYALSGGGPILHPQLDAIVLVPMFPHSLSSRPIVIEGNRRINIIITPNNTTSPRVSCDGRAWLNTPAGSHITIRKKPHELHLIHPLDYNYYEALRSKLHWGKKLKYTE
ncbi:MAG TPA: NAD(+) kinase [Gammaproteobacteria bacterium]|nr:NAD(+) kinase [Gammaproteobacteria bacterium]